MTRLFLTVIALVVVLWGTLSLGILPEPLQQAAGWLLGLLSSLVFPLLLISLYWAPGLYRELADRMHQWGERLRTRGHEVEELERKIAHLDKPHHMAQLGQVYLRQGRWGRAAEWFERALERDGAAVDVRYKLALCHFECGRYVEAAELLELVHADKPDHDYGQAYLRLAQSHHRLNRTVRAAEVYATLLRFYPAQPEGSYQYGLLLAAEGERDRARQLMRDVIFTVRHSPRFHRRRNRHWLLKARWWLWRHRG